MTIHIIGKKIGMTRFFSQEGVSVPITVIQIEKNRILQIKSSKKVGYCFVQTTFGTIRSKKINKPKSGHFSKFGIEAGKKIIEFFTEIKNMKNFRKFLSMEVFSHVKFVDVTGVSKGKGFSGTIKRWNFKSQDATHGNSLSHRAPGSIGQNQTPGRVFKRKKMAGQLGNARITIQNLSIYKIDKEKELLLVCGSVPGSVGTHLILKPSVKKTREHYEATNNKQ